MSVTPAPLPTLYEYYASGPITSGLSVENPYFTLNDKNITLLSGAMHYFRIPPDQWQDRLRKMRAAGLNTVETYIPWNLHEPKEGVFDFGTLETDFSQNRFLDLERYLQTAKQEDLFVIVRPGPYICAEFEWGGFPSWLLQKSGVQVRTSEETYMSAVRKYFNVLLPLLAALQFMNGGPIVAFQVENEYGSSPIKDLDYVEQLRTLFIDNGIKELLLSSDGASNGQAGTLPGLLFQTVNFGSDPKRNFDLLVNMQPDKPVMAMEFWDGWFDRWTEEHHTMSAQEFHDIYEAILTYPASVNLYMFHGGTNFAFLNGANLDNQEYLAATTSYDYDAPLTEAGDYTEKYEVLRDLIRQYNPVATLTPDPPELTLRTVYPTVAITEQLNYTELMDRLLVRIFADTPLSMETVGQSFGYIAYHAENLELEAHSVLTITGYIHDSVMVLVNGKLISKPLTSKEDFNGFGYWKLEDSTIELTGDTPLSDATLDLVVENWGRVNFGDVYSQSKGLNESNRVLINDREVEFWVTLPMEFQKAWIAQIERETWPLVDDNQGIVEGPGAYKATFNISTYSPGDSYLDMRGWSKGVVLVNDFVLGRYCSLGPQQSLYLPGSLLYWGENKIVVFENFAPGTEIKFAQNPIYGTP